MYTREQFEEPIDLPQGAIEALTSFKNLESFRPENRHLRLPGLQTLVDALTTTYQLPCKIKVTNEYIDQTEEDGVTIYPIILRHSLSSMSCLIAFAKIRQMTTQEEVNDFEAKHWAAFLFKTVDPEHFEGLMFEEASGGFYSPGTSMGSSAMIPGINAPAQRSVYEYYPYEDQASGEETEDSGESDLRSTLITTLQQTEGSVVRTAALLGVSPSTVRRRAERFDVDIDSFRQRTASESFTLPPVRDEFDDSDEDEDAER